MRDMDRKRQADKDRKAIRRLTETDGSTVEAMRRLRGVERAQAKEIERLQRDLLDYRRRDEQAATLGRAVADAPLPKWVDEGGAPKGVGVRLRVAALHDPAHPGRAGARAALGARSIVRSGSQASADLLESHVAAVLSRRGGRVYFHLLADPG